MQRCGGSCRGVVGSCRSGMGHTEWGGSCRGELSHVW